MHFLLMHFPQQVAIDRVTQPTSDNNPLALCQIKVDIYELLSLLHKLKAEVMYFDDPLKKQTGEDIAGILETYQQQYLLINAC